MFIANDAAGGAAGDPPDEAAGGPEWQAGGPAGGPQWQATAGLLEHLPTKVVELERAGKVTRTFRRLDPERQLAVIEAILGEAAEAGPDGAGVRGIAARAGVSVGSLYQYFPDRGGMVGVAAEIAGAGLSAELRQYRDAMADLPLREGLVAYVLVGVEWSRSHEDLLRFFSRAAYQGDVGLGGAVVAPVAAELFEMVRAMLTAAVARGEAAADLDVDAAAHLVHALTLSLGDCRLLPHLDDYYLLLDGASLEERAGQLAEFVLTAVSHAGGPRATKKGRR
jgi:AcrR family transcriptional regulator